MAAIRRASSFVSIFAVHAQAQSPATHDLIATVRAVDGEVVGWIERRKRRARACPLYPRKRTSELGRGMNVPKADIPPFRSIKT